MSTNSVRIYRALAEQIVRGEFTPGSKLDEKALAERFNVSRTPVREALRELGARGMIELLPHRGGVVANIGADELADMLEAESELEALCARLAAQRMTAVERKQLELIHARGAECVARADDSGYLDMNHEFHAAINSGAHNRTLLMQVGALRDRLAPFRQAQSDVEHRLAVSHQEHQSIVEAIARSDAEASYAAMRAHHARLGANVLRLLSTPPRTRTG